MIRIARFFAPGVEPWQENDLGSDFQSSKDAIQRHLRVYLGPSLYQLSSEDLEGLIIAAGEKPAKTPDLAAQLIQSMTDNFWDWGDAPWIKHGIFIRSPKKPGYHGNTHDESIKMATRTIQSTQRQYTVGGIHDQGT
jgi:hypothetical protein